MDQARKKALREEYPQAQPMRPGGVH
jgi:hypothetical protein